MNEPIRLLAVLLRQAQWLLDELAHEMSAGRCAPQRLAEGAGLLEDTARLMREHTGGPVIDSDTQP